MNGSPLTRRGESACTDKVVGGSCTDTSMAIEYINRSGEKYYLHVGATKTGKPKYYVARHARGALADAIPDGFEIYENPKGQVSLRKILPKPIFDEELSAVMPWRWQVGRDSISERFWSYEAQLQFALVDEQKRQFQTRRYCYLGRINDWLDIGDRGPLAKLAKLYIKQLGQESYYELF